MDRLIEFEKEIEKEIESIESTEWWLKKRIVEIRRKQYLYRVESKWITSHYELLRINEGPIIIISTRGIIKAEWGDEKIEYKLSSKAQLKLLEVEEYLNQHFP